MTNINFREAILGDKYEFEQGKNLRQKIHEDNK